MGDTREVREQQKVIITERERDSSVKYVLGEQVCAEVMQTQRQSSVKFLLNANVLV